MLETVLKEVLHPIHNELQELNQRVSSIEAEQKEIKATMATKKDVAEIPFIKQAVMETNQEIKQVLENQKSTHEILGEHEVSIRTLRRKPV